ncbi:MAG TPA: AMP-binding protein [Stellaceae bacterium]|nr:AMP-binding protein [Stellaceae bacterium]
MAASRADATRARWLEVLATHKREGGPPDARGMWCPSLDAASRNEIRAIQDAKLAALTPFLYENSGFYRRRFDRLGLAPTDIRGVDDLAKWPVVDKREMMEDALAHPPYGTYSTMTEQVWAEHGWMMFSSSGSTGAPRVFRYSQRDRALWAWANARALAAMGIGKGDTVFLITGFGPHVFAWGVEAALVEMGVPIIPGGGMDARGRANIVTRFKPSVIVCTPSYMLRLGRVLQELGHDPAAQGVRTLFVGGEPAMGIDETRQRIQSLWGARLVEFYGCTEAAPHVGGFTCPMAQAPGRPVASHLLEDVQVWETVDAATLTPVADGARGLTVCTSLNSESSPQLRFLVGDYTVLDRSPCPCGRNHVRAIGAFVGRADDLINLRGIKMFPAEIEEIVRAIPETGDEFEIVLTTSLDALDVMTVRIEHPEHAAPDALRKRLQDDIRARCEVRVEAEVLAPGTLPKTEFKAKRVKDLRRKS